MASSRTELADRAARGARPSRPAALIVIVLANIGLFALMAAQTGRFSWSARSLFDWGGNLGLLSLHTEPWRLVSGMFLHASPGHILGNMVLLAITGTFLERKLGSVRFLIGYFTCGIAASVLSAWYHPDIVGIGASGAIAGLLGMLIVLYVAGGAREISGSWITQTVVINALYSLAPNVDWTAHLGGLFAGFIVGTLYLPSVRAARLQ